MNKQKILNWVGGIWFVINLPVIPFAGSLVYTFAAEYFLNEKITFAIITFVAFLIILFLSKILVGRFVNTPVILSLIPFLYAALQLVVVQDYLVQYRPVLLGIIGIILLAVICLIVVKLMRGDLNKKI